MKAGFRLFRVVKTSNPSVLRLFTSTVHCVVFKEEIFSSPYFPVFSRNAGKYGPEKNPYLDTFHAVALV